MAETLTLAWRQYRLERRMFWRNPSAAFFNFLLPLLFLLGGGLIIGEDQHDLNLLVPASAGCSSGFAARRCRRAPTSAAWQPTRSPTRRCRSRSSSSRGGCSSGSGG